jgi:hypothetical protein
MSTAQSAYTSALTVNSSIYSRTGCDKFNVYYETIQLGIVENGCYSFISNSGINIYSSIHKDSFDPLNSLKNIISKDNGNYGSDQVKIHVYLQANSSYILVVERNHSNGSESFSITTSSSKNLNFKQISEY